MSAYDIAGIIVVTVNVISFAAFGIDKWKARHKQWRIPEATLLLLAFFGGALGAFAGMKVFHHKTHHQKFNILVPLFIVIQAVLLMYLLLSKI